MFNVLEHIMNNSIITFGNTFWLQLCGTAMGTPAAHLYSTIAFGYFENCQILLNFGTNLLYYKRYVDDIFGIWIPTTPQAWDNFKTTGQLQWNIEEPSLSMIFPDRKINIIGNKLCTTTYQKRNKFIFLDY